ncbi:MAG TPA: thioesterase family protein [Alphaproteobacteria bacterium]|nr:thioesterase family protein [Alphaproteobacteria bacterium]
MADWVETFKGAILVSEYDSETHMNSQIYVSRFDQATWFLLHSIDVTPATVKRQGRRIAIVRQTYQFLKELRGGELVVVKSGFVAVGSKYLRFVHQMFDTVTQRLVATSDCTAVQASLKSGRTVALPAALKSKAEAHLVAANVGDGVEGQMAAG